MTALQTSGGTTTAWRKVVEKAIHNFYSDLFDHVHLRPHHLREDGHVIPKVLPSEVRHAIMSVKNHTSPGLDRIKSEHLKYLHPLLINRTLAMLFTLSIVTFLSNGKAVLLHKKGGPQDIGNYRPICLLFVNYKLFTTSSPKQDRKNIR
ncbi:hypothetical protein RB195_002372 [Necator americanus]